MPVLPLFLSCLLVLPAAPPARSLDELRHAARLARPGDRLLLAPGEHRGPLVLDRVRGEPGRPITIAAADPDHPPVIRGGDQCIHLVACAHLTLEDLVLEGAASNGLNADDAGVLHEPARGITLRRLTVRDVGPEGNSDAIKLSGLADFLVEDCLIDRWGRDGSGIDMVGCRDGLILNTSLRHADTAGASGIQAKGGSRDVTIRRCRFFHAGRRAVNIGGSTGLAYFRPEPAGFEAANITVEGCEFVGSEAAVAFVGCDGATVRYCTIVRPARWVARILQETRAPGFVPCRNGSFTDNIIVHDLPSRFVLNIGDATAPESFAFARNVWFRADRPGDSAPTLPAPEAGGVYGIDPSLRDPAGGDFAPDSAGPGRRAGARALPAR